MQWSTNFITVALALNTITIAFGFCSHESVQETHQPKADPSYPAVSRIYNGSVECEYGEHVTCIRKCCDVDYYYVDNKTCIYKHFLTFEVPVFKYGTVIVDNERVRRRFVHGLVECASDKQKGWFLNTHLHNFYVQRDGKMWIPDLHKSFDLRQYCVELTDEGLRGFFCSFDDVMISITWSYKLNVFGMMISLPSLLITFIIYAVLPLRNLHGMSLMCYIFTLFATYVIHMFNYFYVSWDKHMFPICRTSNILSMFFFLSSFFWMNVMSYDIWWTFRGFINLRAIHEKSDWKYFLYYSTYAWISPLIIVGFVLSLRKNVKQNSWYDPGLTGNQCTLTDGIPTLIYYYGPLAMITVTDTVLFILTARNIRKVQSDTLILQEGNNSVSHKYHRKRFYLYLKLYLIMGINWSMEIVSYYVSWKFESVPRSVWYLTDFCNAAHGVAIFVIFVFKKSIWKLLKKRYRLVTKGKLNLAKSATMLSFNRSLSRGGTTTSSRSTTTTR